MTLTLRRGIPRTALDSARSHGAKGGAPDYWKKLLYGLHKKGGYAKRAAAAQPRAHPAHTRSGGERRGTRNDLDACLVPAAV